MPGSCSKPTAASSVTPNGGPFSPRPAYRWACEVSVYLERDRRRTGGGRALYGALFVRLAGRGLALPWPGPGTTSPGPSGRSPRGRTRRPNPADAPVLVRVLPHRPRFPGSCSVRQTRPAGAMPPGHDRPRQPARRRLSRPRPAGGPRPAGPRSPAHPCPRGSARALTAHHARMPDLDPPVHTARCTRAPVRTTTSYSRRCRPPRRPARRRHRGTALIGVRYRRRRSPGTAARPPASRRDAPAAARSPPTVVSGHERSPGSYGGSVPTRSWCAQYFPAPGRPRAVRTGWPAW